MKDRSGRCQAELGSMTHALAAQRALATRAIPCQVYKSETSTSRRGCSYGIRFSCGQENNVKRALEQAGIAVRGWNGEE